MIVEGLASVSITFFLAYTSILRCANLRVRVRVFGTSLVQAGPTACLGMRLGCHVSEACVQQMLVGKVRGEQNQADFETQESKMEIKTV